MRFFGWGTEPDKEGVLWELKEKLNSENSSLVGLYYDLLLSDDSQNIDWLITLHQMVKEGYTSNYTKEKSHIEEANQKVAELNRLEAIQLGLGRQRLCSILKQVFLRKKADEEQRKIAEQRQLDLQESRRKFEEKQRLEEEQRKTAERNKAMYRQSNRCQYCGGAFSGLFTKKCSICGKPKDYR